MEAELEKEVMKTGRRCSGTGFLQEVKEVLETQRVSVDGLAVVVIGIVYARTAATAGLGVPYERESRIAEAFHPRR